MQIGKVTTLALAILLSSWHVVIADVTERETAMFGELKLVDEVVPGRDDEAERVVESENGVSEIREILGRPTRIIPNTGDEARYVSYRLGEGKGLQAGKAYVLQVEYPEDAPRTMFIHNRGAETQRGLHTGPTAGDVLQGRYVDSNIESLKYPLSGKHETFQTLFFLQDRFAFRINRGGPPLPRDLTPADGIPVIISQWKARNAPLSQGAAVSRVALYEVVDPGALKLKINYPPADLPRRHLFWREEMSDGVVAGDNPGWDTDVDWYENKAKLMQFLGMNTYSIDMLEFGHNQGWDTTPGPKNWMNASKTPQRWENILKRLAAGDYDDMTVMPYYEYAGSVGGNSPGTKKLARPLGDSDAYTHITWSEKAYADVTEPAILEDAKTVLDLTITRWKELMPFTGAWIRPRPSHMPVSFSDNAISKFSKEAMRGRKVTREQLRERGELYQRYIAWWNDQRKAFLTDLRDHLRKNVDKEAIILFTPDATEAGTPLPAPGRNVVTDDVAAWKALAAEKGLEIAPISFDEVVKKNMQLDALLRPHATWGKWEWEHSVPSIDPKNYAKVDGVISTFTFNRMYTVSSPEALDAFRTTSGLAMVRHYCLNENEMDDKVGYFVIDVDRTREHMMHAEVVAVANGDPWYLGYLAGHQFNRGFPHHARRFNAAYLSLPALPSTVLKNAASDDAVVVRVIRTPRHGTWLAVANTAMSAKENVRIKLPARGAVSDAATAQPLQAANGELTLSLDAAELRAIHIR